MGKDASMTYKHTLFTLRCDQTTKTEGRKKEFIWADSSRGGESKMMREP